VTSKPTPKDNKSDAGAGVKSAARIFSIFEYFERVRSPRTLSEISQDLHYPVSSALALLRSAHAMGYLTYDPDSKTYFPSLRFAMLGQWISDQLFQGGAIVQMMEHLAATTGDTVLLGIQNGLWSQHIHIIHTSQSLRYHPPTGTMRPLLRSAVGRVLLGLQSKETILKTVERINISGIDEKRKFDPKAVLADIERVRRDGYAFSANLFTEGAGIVAVALPPRPGDVPMAISIGGPVSRINEKSLPTLLKQINAAVADYLL